VTLEKVSRQIISKELEMDGSSSRNNNLNGNDDGSDDTKTTNLEDILLFPPKMQSTSKEKTTIAATTKTKFKTNSSLNDTVAKMVIPPRPKDINGTGHHYETLMNSKSEASFTPTKIASTQATKNDHQSNTSSSSSSSNTTTTPSEPKEPNSLPYPITNATLTDLVHQEIENWFADGPDPKLSWSDTQNDGIYYNTEGEMGIVIPSNEAEEELIDEEIEEWEIDNIKSKDQEEDVDQATTNNASHTVVNDDDDNDEKSKDNTKTTIDDDVSQKHKIQQEGEAPIISPIVASSSRPTDHSPTTVDSTKEAPTAKRNPSLPPHITTSSSPTPISLPPCHSLDAHTVSHFSCKLGVPSVLIYTVFAFFPLFVICCCWKHYCGGKSKGKDGQRGEYRAVASTYGDASFDNAFTDNFSDDDDDDFGFMNERNTRNDNNNNIDGDVEESWGKSGGKRVLEMSNLSSTQDDLSLEEMNG